MKGNKEQICSVTRFRRFARHSYSVFCSCHKAVTIGVLAVAMLTYATPKVVAADHETVTEDKRYELDEIEVTSSRVPKTMSQTTRILTILDREAIEAAPVQTVNDLLKFAVGVDVRQRGTDGMQTDISIRGGTFDQITILLNGVNICDPQTGHNAATFPVDISEIERIEVLQGPAGLTYGASSLMGAINIVTKIHSESSIDVALDGGSFGYANGSARVNFNTGKVRQQVSGGYTRSDGYSRSKSGKLNANFDAGKLFYQGMFDSDVLDVKWHFGFNEKNYGSNTFYSTASDEQFEHVRKYFAAVQASTKGKVYQFKPSVYWNRSADRFEFFKGAPDRSPYNYHQTDVFGVTLGNHLTTVAGKTAFGAEMRNEGIISTNLGEPLNTPRKVYGSDAMFKTGLNRTNISFYLEHNYSIRWFNVSAGVIAVKNTGNEMNFRWYPSVDMSFQILKNFKAYASYNTSLRMPTFTELYYSVGGHKADKYLKPEEIQSGEVGFKYLSPGIRGTLNGFYYNGRNMIDWIKDGSQGADAPWQSVNHTTINTFGIEASGYVNFLDLLGRDICLRSIELSYSFINQDKRAGVNMQSKYALEYLRHKVVAQVNFMFFKRLGLNVSYRWQDRVGNYQENGVMKPYQPYSLLDARVFWKDRFYMVYVDANNLLNKTYYDYGNIPQPKIWFKAGLKLHFNFSKK